jgi:hypothetical protein
MERRHFLKLTLGVAAGAAALGASAQAAPLAPQLLKEPDQRSATNEDLHPALTSQDEVAHLKPEQVRWHHHWHHHWRHHWHRRWHRWHHWHRHW